MKTQVLSVCIGMLVFASSATHGGDRVAAADSATPSKDSQAAPAPSRQGTPFSISGIYPHLAMFNDEGECGTGAVVPWAGRLWVVTYAPHMPKGSSDKLYEITPSLEQIVRPESIGGTPANRMIHRESQQLFIGPHAIDASGNVRTIPYTAMFGRPTGIARHLTEPASKIYYATMEEGFYEVDVKTLEVKELWTDEQQRQGRYADLPGYHGKGFYSGQGRVVYANNGDHAKEALSNPTVPSGVLAQWDGKADKWTVVRRNQFTEVTGPGGIEGNSKPETDPIWSMGWDHRSLILMCLDRGAWHRYRLPKSSHSYDGAHGWNTEWPRIRTIGEGDWLMTMHGAFWKFPPKFSSERTGGISMRSNYLKVIGDFARWSQPNDAAGDRIVFGCDDTARNEFLNKRKAKGEISAPQSQSNLWFVDPASLDQLGPAIGRGGLWVNEAVAAEVPSDPFLVHGFDRCSLHLSHTNDQTISFVIEVDEKGDNRWRKSETIMVEPHGSQWVDLSSLCTSTWIRLTASHDLTHATAWLQMSRIDRRSNTADERFASLATIKANDCTGGLIRARGENKRTLSLAAINAQGKDIGYYELDGEMRLSPVNDSDLLSYTKSHTAIPVDVLLFDEASVIFVDDSGRRWRLPRGIADSEMIAGWGGSRVAREVATERDFFNAAGTFFELPAENAGGFAKIRPVATHGRLIHDFCSYRGLFVMTGVGNVTDGQSPDPHVIRSDDGRAALWVGAIDDAWKLGKPRGVGGPWMNTAVNADQPSDPYLMTGYDQKSLLLSHTDKQPVEFTVELDVTGNGDWRPYQSITVPAGQPVSHTFADWLSAYWLRVKSKKATTATAQLTYR